MISLINWKNWKLRTKLVVSLLGCSLASLLVAIGISYVTATGGMNEIAQHGESALTQGSRNQLIALRDVKKAQIESIDKVLETILVVAFTSLPTP